MIHFLLQAEADGKKVRALIVINPGNPTGGVLSKANQVDVVRFAEQNNMVLIADEVYATNVYAGAQSRHAMALRQYCQYKCRRLCCHIANVNSARGPVALRHRKRKWFSGTACKFAGNTKGGPHFASSCAIEVARHST